jgi:ATP-dependent helicase/nuclease subunit B
MADVTPPVPAINSRFVAHLAAGGAVLTATRRQARLIRRLFDESQIAAGRQAWPTADVLPFSAWVAARWQEATRRDSSLPLLLTESQAAWPWRRLADEFIDAALLDSRDLADAARRAWVSLVRYGGSLDLLGQHPMTNDQRQFLAWARAVESTLSDNEWIDPGAIEPALAARVSLLARSAPLLLAGFGDNRPRAVDVLLQALTERGWSVAIAPLGGAAGVAACSRAADPAAEISAIVAWARQRLESDPQTRLAVIVPDLQDRRAELERRFAAALQPELEVPGSLERDRLYDFAGGPALSAFGIAEAAMDCLGAGERRLDHAAMSRLLRCRHVEQAGEQEPRTRLDVRLRGQALLDRPTRSISRMATEAGCPEFGRALDDAHRELSAVRGRGSADEWATAFGAALSAWGWPGSGPLASDEYQVAQELRERLDSFATMARCAPPMSFGEARAEFARLLDSPFQPERGDAAIMVFDSLEPPAVAFDGLWVAGVTASAWPRAAVHDPFLPISLQATLKMPAVTAERALAEAVATTGAWLGTADEVIFSWPERQDDAVVEPSRLLPVGLPEAPRPIPVATRDASAFRHGGLQGAGADPAPPLAAAESGGGSRILDLQAKCPFRAFAELRLGSAPLEEPVAGVDARGRGNVLHRSLELIWRSLADQEALRALAPEALQDLLETSLARALTEELSPDAGRRTLALEAEWQRAAIRQLLELERARPPFRVVAIEESREGVFAGLDLRLRADRIDHVADGLVIVDYKTGRAETSQWRGARPDAPQLPLYALMQVRPVSAIAFAVAGSRAARYRGVGAREGIAEGIMPAEEFMLTEDKQSGFSWQAVRGRWAGWLASLAQAYVEGDAAVDPKQPQTCRLCHLSTLCRVAPELGPDAEEAGDE